MYSPISLSISRRNWWPSESPHALTDDLDASLQGGRCLPIRQQRIERVDGAQATRLFGGIAYLCERHSRVTPTHESS
jgi:hypothetical protein